MTAKLNEFLLNSIRLNNGTDTPNYFSQFVDQLWDSKPVTKVEFIDVDGNATDISTWYLEGANFEQIKDRAVSEIQAGNFDIVLANQDDYFSEYVSTSLFYLKAFLSIEAALLPFLFFSGL